MKQIKFGFPRLRLLHSGLLLIGTTLLLELIFLGTLTSYLVKAEREIWLGSRAYLTGAEANGIIKYFYQAAASLFAYGFTRNKDLLALYERSADNLQKQAETTWLLLQLSPSTPPKLMEEGQKLQHQALTALTDVKKMLLSRPGSLGPQDVARIGSTLTSTMREYFVVISGIVTSESEARAERLKGEALALNLVKTLIVSGFLLNAVISLAALWFWVKNVTTRIDVLVEDAHRLGRKQNLLELQGGHDEIAELEKVFHDVHQKLQEADELKQQFTALISHELRSPLTAISGTLTLLNEGIFGELNDMGKERINRASISSKRLLNLINELLDIHKMEAGKFTINVKEVDLREILEVAVDEVLPLALARGVDIVLESETCMVEADPERLAQVVINFLSNAVKYSPKGELIEIVSVAGPDTAEVRVSDHGPGIPTEFEDKIFGRYEQSARAVSGTGLGLFVCKGIIDQHNGTIGVENLARGGASFWFGIPLRQPGAS